MDTLSKAGQGRFGAAAKELTECLSRTHMNERSWYTLRQFWDGSQLQQPSGLLQQALKMLPILIGGLGLGFIALKALSACQEEEMKHAENLLYEVEAARPSKGEGTVAIGPVYRNIAAKDAYPTLDGVKTLYELFTRSAKRYAKNPCLGSRPQVDGVAGPFEFITYEETAELVAAIGSAFAAVGVTAHQKCSIYGGNCAEWMIAMQACNRQSVYCVPLYDSLGENAVEFIINHSESSIVFVSRDKLDTMLKALPAAHKGLTTLVYWGTHDETLPDAEKAAEAAGVKAYSWEQFLGLGKASLAPAVPPKPEDLCTIMYTSGTTGDPKGVMISHSAVVAEVAGLHAFLEQISYGNSITERDVVLSYLPLAHIFDRSTEEMFLSVGARIGYYQGDVKKLVDDIAALKPTLFIGVPRVFDRIYASAMAKIEEKGGLAAKLFKWGYSRKSARLKRNIPADRATPFFDKLVFSKVKARLGGRVKLIVSGGAPLAGHVEEFLKVTMCAPVVQGYGLTETCAGSFISVPDLSEMAGTVGPPLPCTAFRLEAVPEMNYDPAGSPPRGEVVIGGPTLFRGYYKDEKKTAEDLTADGWFHTGDVGELTPEGALRIIDRKKNIFKLSQGEYIAVEKIEAVYKKNPLVEQIWVYGNSFENILVAVVVPAESALTSWAADAGISGDFVAVTKDPRANTYVWTELNKTAKEAKLKGFEMVRKIHLDAEQFTVEKNLITPTFKLKRPQLLQHYKAQVDAMYGKKQQ